LSYRTRKSKRKVATRTGRPVPAPADGYHETSGSAGPPERGACVPALPARGGRGDALTDGSRGRLDVERGPLRIWIRI